MEHGQSHLLRDDEEGWRGWFGGKVANAEAAIASVFSNEGGANAHASPLPDRSEQRLLQDEEEQFFAPRMSRTTSGLSFSDAWCAVRRAAVAAMGGFEQADGAVSPSGDTDPQERQERFSVEQRATIVKLENRPVLKHCGQSDPNVSPQPTSAHFSMSDCSEMEQLGKDAQFDSYDEDFPPLEQNKHTSTLCDKQLKLVIQCDTQVAEKPECAINEERLAQLRSRFDIMFEQNGGAECVARVKQIGDVQLMGMRDSTKMDSRVLAELREAKHILDNALSSLESAARNRTDETGEAASAANSVIEQTKENVNREDDLVDDCSRLLAVFASNVCSNVLRCVEERDVHSWSDRVKHLVDIASVGVGQLRTICFSFAAELSSHERCTNTLKDVSVRHVLQCVALAVAAFHVEAAERAVQYSAQF
ncbi:F-box associated (FBA) [Gracilaria domingensis]|nr:F-box associated (FBA) [Gracilaria domingensis]